MSTFGTTDNVSGTINIFSDTIEKENERKSLSNAKGVIRPRFEWNNRSDKSFKEVVATGVPMGGKESFWNGFDFNVNVMERKIS